MYICNFSLSHSLPHKTCIFGAGKSACLTSSSSLFIPLTQKVHFPPQDLCTCPDCLSFLYIDLCCSFVSWSCRQLSKWWLLWLLYFKHLSLPPTLSSLCIAFSPLSTRHVWHIFILFIIKPEWQFYENRSFLFSLVHQCPQNHARLTQQTIMNWTEEWIKEEQGMSLPSNKHLWTNVNY